MSVSYWQDGGLDATPEEVDVLVVGGGLAGWSSAYWLARGEPDLRIAVVDRGNICAGASGRNAGFVTCGSVEHYGRQVARHGAEMARGLWQMAQDNIALIREEVVERGVECGFRQAGTYSLAGTDHELGEIAESARIMADAGIEVSVVDAAHVATHLGARGFAGGALYHDDGEVHPVQLARGIARLTHATFYPHEEVFGLHPQDDGRVLVRTRTRRFLSMSVVLATNAYAPLLDPWFEDKIFPTRGQIIVTDPVERFMAAPCYANFVLDYFRQLPDGRVLIGGFRQLEKEREVGTEDIPNPRIHQALLDFLGRHFERLEGVGISHRWAGIMGFSVDGVPLIGSLPGRPQIYFVGGFTAHGVGFAFKAGALLAGLMLRGEVPPYLSARRLKS